MLHLQQQHDRVQIVNSVMYVARGFSNAGTIAQQYSYHMGGFTGLKFECQCTLPNLHCSITSNTFQMFSVSRVTGLTLTGLSPMLLYLQVRTCKLLSRH